MFISTVSPIAKVESVSQRKDDNKDSTASTLKPRSRGSGERGAGGAVRLFRGVAGNEVLQESLAQEATAGTEWRVEKVGCVLNVVLGE